MTFGSDARQLVEAISSQRGAAWRRLHQSRRYRCEKKSPATHRMSTVRLAADLPPQRLMARLGIIETAKCINQ